MVGVAQSVEHQVVALGVEGSSPFTHPIYIMPFEEISISIQEIFKIYCFETFAERDIFLSGKEGENVNRRNT